MVSLMDRTEVHSPSFNAIRISIASPEQIRSWSHGQVSKPETINYRTLRPEKDGLFCERIFGPTKDWECFCGKYKRIRYRGVICDRCGVEVTRSRVRRERMGHIELAAPVAHIWFSKGTPSRLGLLLDLSPRNLERVLYFAQHVIISVDDEMREEARRLEKETFDQDMRAAWQVAAAKLNALLETTPSIIGEISQPEQELEQEIATEIAALLASDETAADKRDALRSLLQTATIKREALRLLLNTATNNVAALWNQLDAAADKRATLIDLLRADPGNRVALLVSKESDPDQDATLLQTAIDDLDARLGLLKSAADKRTVLKALLQTDPGKIPMLVASGRLPTLKIDDLISLLLLIAAGNIDALKDLLQTIANEINDLTTTTQTVNHRTGEIIIMSQDDVEAFNEKVDAIVSEYESESDRVMKEYKFVIEEMYSLQPMQLLTETRFRELNGRFGHVFVARMGAEAVLDILREMNLEELREKLLEEMQSTSGQRRKKAIKRLRVVEAFRKSGNRIEWLILKVLPVLPPELRPMVQLDGGRFATSDLNDLYRRVINRNNRLKRLMELGAPEIIIRNEKRMLQEAVDALIDNGRRGRPIAGSHNHKLKSLSDLLRGKQGRFRQNLLGKRVDYSGRSVIVSGPDLELNQCGLPKRMALELFKPFVMHRLVLLGISPNIKSAKRMVESARGEVWDILEEVIKERPVLINRAPTLHRLGIQAFMPVLIEGSAIQIHPLVCPAFNADFDGDQMAVHVPLSRMAVLEAKETMISVNNMLSPASGEPLVAPTLDMVLGCFYLTDIRENVLGSGRRFFNSEEALIAHDTELVDIQAEIEIWRPEKTEGPLKTSVGRIIFNEVLPDEIGFKNEVMDKGALKDLTSQCYRTLGNRETAQVLDRIKTLGFHYATVSGITIAINDIQVSSRKQEVIEQANELVKSFEDDYMLGLMTEEERYTHTVNAWTEASDAMEVIVKDEMDSYGGIAVMAVSGAKGNIAQIKQMAGMRGLMSNPKGRIIDLPIKSSFREGLTALEYFISTHGARKGLADTALRTADSGYLTRRLTDVCQDVIVLEEDCGSTEGIWLAPNTGDPLVATQDERAMGQLAATPVADPKTGEILIDRNQEIDEEAFNAAAAAGVVDLFIRSPLTCQAHRGLCRMCYGRSPATGRMVKMGEAVGIIAAQSIGEPGTQLTMRTFHTGGVAGQDITSGLPRVEELFEARVPKGSSILSDIDGAVSVDEDVPGRRVKITSREEYREDYYLPLDAELHVKNGEEVEAGKILALPKGTELPKKRGRKKAVTPEDAVVANVGGTVEIQPTGALSITWADTEDREHLVAVSALLLVRDGEEVKAGAALTAGPLNPHDILRIKGKEDVQSYLVDEVQKVYRSQGVSIHNKHIEVVVRQMLRRVQVDSAGDAEYIPGQSIDLFDFQAKNAQVLAEGGEPATAKPVLLGVTRSSLLTDSFLAAASFQETTRVLTEAAASGGVDHLLGLKENVIIGRLIPARVDAELPTVEEQYMLGDDLILQGTGDEILDSELIKEFTDPLPDNLEEIGNGHAEVEVENPAID